ncbi:MAG: DUF3179 domain-containing protein [Xanthomonadales bacterium]|nr:DUF3179 domain-containing protein [Xanthomonadales bacterium]
MTFKPNPNHNLALVLRIRTRSVGLLRNCLLASLLLPFFLLSQAAMAQSPPIMVLNSGLNDAWYAPETDGQGFFITIYPELGSVSLAWFTYDTELPSGESQANLGDAGHRWLTAVGPFSGNTATLTIYVTRGGLFNSVVPATSTDLAGDGTITLEFRDCTSGVVSYDITSLGKSGQIPIQRVATGNIPLCEALIPEDPEVCTRPEPDKSHGPNNPTVTNGTIISRRTDIVDGGPGPDGIPPLETPAFTSNLDSTGLDPEELVVGVKVGNDIRAYPHDIMNWHEVVNDTFTTNGSSENATLSYCPLTGSAMLWKSFMEPGDETFGTSGMLFNSNLILYDRERVNYWSQMLEQAVVGTDVTRIPDRLPVVETSWATWKTMYPETKLLTRDTGFSRDYDDYPYGDYLETERLIFPVNNSNDFRLWKKTRVLGINVGDSSKVYPINVFSNAVEVINDTTGDMQTVVAGSSDLNFGVVYNRQLEDCTVLEFEAVQNRLPIVMRDNEGNEWDAFGVAVNGDRAGQHLEKTNSYIAYWFAWTAFFPGADIHQ